MVYYFQPIDLVTFTLPAWLAWQIVTATGLLLVSRHVPAVRRQSFLTVGALVLGFAAAVEPAADRLLSLRLLAQVAPAASGVTRHHGVAAFVAWGVVLVVGCAVAAWRLRATGRRIR